MNPLAPYWGLIKNGLLVGVLVWFGLFCRSCGKEAGDTEVLELKLQYAQETAHVAKLAKDAAEKARKAEHAWGDTFIAIALQHEKERTDGAQAAYDRAVDDVRTGRLKLRPWWTCPVPRAAKTPGSAGKPDDAADLRAEAAARIVRIGAEADAYARACQATLIAERQ